jgi:hypothetical protein
VSTEQIRFMSFVEIVQQILYTGEQSRGGRDGWLGEWKGRVGYRWMRGTYLQTFICLIWVGYFKEKMIWSERAIRFETKVLWERFFCISGVWIYEWMCNNRY